jgi:predicted RNA-binding Zn-ribbon protein involved in translation (DUF1610 family)
LQRLALALEEADSAAQLRSEVPAELELSGLTPAELELIRAYIQRDLPWLRGWHAAAEEVALNPPPVSRLPLQQRERKSVLARKRQPLQCAVCGAAADWKSGQGILPCPACGSQLFRAGNPR